MPANGGKNAALLAVRILAISDDKLAQKYQEFVQQQHDGVLAKDALVQSKGWESVLNQ